MIAETLLIRELLVIFSGNELTIGIILANWLIAEAAGAYFLGKTIEKQKDKIKIFLITQIIFSLTFPLSIYLTRILRHILGVMPGEVIGLLPVIYSSLFILFPVSFSHGALFTYSCKILAEITGEDKAESIGKVYVFETAGTIAGGILITYLFIPLTNSFNTSFIISALNLFLCLIFFILQDKNFKKPLFYLMTFILFLFSFCIFSGVTLKIHWYSIKKQFSPYNVIDYRNSIFGNIAVIKEEEQYTFYYDGTPFITTPIPDIAFVEEITHFPMLAHPMPRKILILSGGAGGIIAEILKYPVEKIDYAELDPEVMKMLHKYKTTLTEKELKDNRVNIKYTDARFFLKETKEKYDIIFVGFSTPSELQINRFFSKEFFELAKQKLNKKGILVLHTPGSSVYLSRELKSLIGCILNTLQKSFNFVKVIPGDVNIYLASDEEINLSPQFLIKNLKKYDLKTNFITPFYIEYKLSKRWFDWFYGSLKGYIKGINSDYHPISVWHTLRYWDAQFAPYLCKIFKTIEKIKLWQILLMILALSLIFIIKSFKKDKKWVMFFVIASSGFCGMIFSLILSFLFQITYGYLYYWIGILTSSFMAGTATGGYFSTKNLRTIKNDFKILTAIEFLILILALLLISIHGILNLPLFILLNLISGSLLGLEFPLCNKIYLRGSESISESAGLLYAADLIGGWLGGLTGGVIIFPLLGLKNTCMLLILLKILSILQIRLTK